MMAADRERFWTEIDQQSANGRSQAAVKPAQRRPTLKPVLIQSVAEPEPARRPISAPEWSGVLDLINGARVQVEEQTNQLLEQAEAFRETIRELRQEAETTRQQLRMSEAQAREARAEAERQVSQVLAQAEDRTRAIQAQADAQIAQARSIAQAAEERAANAEDWLVRIEAAAITLSPMPEAGSISRIA